MTTLAASGGGGLAEPGGGLGLLDVFRRRYLLTLLVRKELRVRYRGSVLGLAWSYVKPAVQFLVFYFVLGVFLQLNRSLQDFAIYLFAGITLMNFFSEAFGNATRAIVSNASLVKKIYLPRELFPVASLLVAGVHLVPQLVILVVAALVTGYEFSVGAVAAFLLGLGIAAVLALGLGLVFAAANVFFRDFENIVDLILLVATWASPVLYPWTLVRDALGDGLALQIYLANPITMAVSMFQRAFWWPGTDMTFSFPPHLWLRAVIAFAMSVAVLVVGQLVFRRLESKFAQEL
ncbi:MAG TPA: ABC transporter permease [Jiangellales bacterium]|nr:ABC transporter permease [Jiangellales bacterium]